MAFAQKIVVRGGGDLATGVVQKLHRAGLAVVILETSVPSAIRRSVALCEAVYEGRAQVEDIDCRKINSPSEIERCFKAGEVPLLIDPHGQMLGEIRPECVVDAILAKRNIGTTMQMAGITIGLGPGFLAGVDVHAVIETMRGHDLGRLILQGGALPDTGVPGEIGGKSSERVLRAPAEGILTAHKKIGETVRQGQEVFSVGEHTVCAPFSGLVRGMLRDGTQIPKGMKTADIDPRTDVDWQTISDKARCLGGAVLEAYLFLRKRSHG